MWMVLKGFDTTVQLVDMHLLAFISVTIKSQTTIIIRTNTLKVQV